MSDVRIVNEWVENETVGESVLKMKMMKQRLEFIYKRIGQQENRIEEHTGYLADTAEGAIRSDRVQRKVWECLVVCEHLIETETAKQVEANKHKMIKTEASRFPDFDGFNDFGIWEENWNKLAKIVV